MPTQVNPSIIQGNMDLNSDISRIKKPDYRFAKNVRFSSSDSGKSWVGEGVKGNTYSFVIPAQLAQNIKFRVVKVDDGYYFMYITDQQNQILVQSSITFIDFALFITDFDAELLAAGWISGLHYTKTADASTPNAYVYELFKTAFYPYKMIGQFVTINIVQDAIDYGIATTSVRPIGSFELGNRLFVWSSCQGELERDLNVKYIVNNGSGFITLDVGSHGFNAKVPFIAKITGVTGFNGLYMVTPNLSNPEYLDTTVPYTVDSPEDGKLTLFTRGYGQIGVVAPVTGGTGFSYNPIVKSVGLNFRTQKQINCTGRKMSYGDIALYWVDKYNNDKVIYVTETSLGITNCALSVFGGKYDLATIQSETNLLQVGVGRMQFNKQLDSGGGLFCGNYIYTGTFLTDNLTETNCINSTNEIPVYKASQSDILHIIGGDASDETTKINELIVSDFLPGVYKFFVLYAIRNVNGVPETTRVGRFPIATTDTSITVTHTGKEIGSEPSSLSSLLFTASIFDKSSHIAAIQNRLVRADFSVGNSPDMTDFCATFQHAVMKKTLTAEFYNIENAVNYVGLMRNDTYAYTAVFEFFNGVKSESATYIDTISIDTDTVTNSAGRAGGRIAGTTSSGVSIFDNFDLTDNTTPITEIYVPFVQFKIPDMDFIIDGVPARSLIKRIWIYMVNPEIEVLLDGVFIHVIEPALFAFEPGISYWQEYYDVATVLTVNARIGAFYSADSELGNVRVDAITGDKLINYGSPKLALNPTGYTGLPNSIFAYTNGNTGTNVGSPTINAQTVQEVNIEVIKYANAEQIVALNATDKVSKGYSPIRYKGSHVIKTATALTNPSINSIVIPWLKLAQYKRPVANKYDRTTPLTSRNTGAYIDTVDGAAGATAIVNVFGGDTYVNAFNFIRKFSPVSPNDKAGEGMRFYHQSRINANMRKLASKNPDQYLYPQNIGLDDWISDAYKQNGVDITSYSRAYDKIGFVDTKALYDPELATIKEFETGICWSPPSALGTLIDEFRNSPPFNIKIESINDGAITFLGVLNGELVTLQHNSFRRHYFNSNNILQTNDNTEILLGSGKVMEANSQVLSLFGCQHKFAAVIAQTEEGGHQTLHWPNVDKRKFCRFGYDGTVSLSVVQNIDSWMQNNFFAVPYVPGNTPAHDGDGIIGVFNPRFNEIIWTVGYGPMQKRTWRESKYITSNPGDCVLYDEGVYICIGAWQHDNLFNPTTLVLNPQLSGLDTNAPGGSAVVGASAWQLVTVFKTPFSIVFDGKKKGFSCFISPTPFIYLPFKNTYFTTSKNFPNKVYVHDSGSAMSWYDEELEEQGYIEFVTNDLPSIYKKFEAVFAEAVVPPVRVEYETEEQESFVVNTEFTSSNNMHRAPIKYNSKVSGVNDASNTGGVFGTWLISRVFFGVNISQRILSFVTKFSAPRQRPFNK